MDTQNNSEADWWSEWKELSDADSLRTRRPEEVVRACRQLGHPQQDRLRGKLLTHLTDLARAYLRPRVRQDLVDGGREVIEEVVEILTVAVLTPSAADGVGFETAFHAKLRQRLVDRIRASLKDRAVIEQEAVDPETGIAREPPDWNQLSPEDNAIIADTIAKLPHMQRKAFQLHRLGFRYTSSNPNESISAMLGKTPKTVQDWVEKAERQILEILGSTK
ncbi:MAG: hypothetical protein K2Z25_07190 [Beijerinckiaceae bacterium]|nr:hypothetical protein [Beijerinckiaceae bacterium]